jgi:trk system potassium uptake protein TrkH
VVGGAGGLGCGDPRLLDHAGLGGFSNRDASLGALRQPAVEIVTIVFALLAGLNYATHYLALVRRTLAPYARDPELPVLFGVLAVTVVMLTVYLLAQVVFTDVGARPAHVAFHAVSISTSLGLATYDYTLWPMFAQIWILFLAASSPVRARPAAASR